MGEPAQLHDEGAVGTPDLADMESGRLNFFFQEALARILPVDQPEFDARIVIKTRLHIVFGDTARHQRPGDVTAGDREAEFLRRFGGIEAGAGMKSGWRRRRDRASWSVKPMIAPSGGSAASSGTGSSPPPRDARRGSRRSVAWEVSLKRCWSAPRAL